MTDAPSTLPGKLFRLCCALRRVRRVCVCVFFFSCGKQHGWRNSKSKLWHSWANNVVYFHTYGHTKGTHSIILTFIISCASWQWRRKNMAYALQRLKRNLPHRSRGTQPIANNSHTIEWWVMLYAETRPSTPTPALALRVQFAFVVNFFFLLFLHSPFVRFVCSFSSLPTFGAGVSAAKTWQNMLRRDLHFLQCHSENGIRMKIFCISGVLILDKIYKLLYAKVFIPTYRFGRRNPLFPSHFVCALPIDEARNGPFQSIFLVSLSSSKLLLTHSPPLGTGNWKREKISLFMQLCS